ncbi:MAG: hypothetical protein ABFC80_02935 [Coriobacteriales bacterium]
MNEHKENERLNGVARNACVYCKHSVTTPESAPQGLGRCMRYPPSPFPIQGAQGQTGTIAVWPTIRLNHDTCGEHLPGKIEVASSLTLVKKDG